MCLIKDPSNQYWALLMALQLPCFLPQTVATAHSLCLPCPLVLPAVKDRAEETKSLDTTT